MATYPMYRDQHENMVKTSAQPNPKSKAQPSVNNASGYHIFSLHVIQLISPTGKEEKREEKEYHQFHWSTVASEQTSKPGVWGPCGDCSPDSKQSDLIESPYV